MELVHRNERRLALGAQHMLDHRGAQQFDLIRRRAAVRVLEGHDLALLGDAKLAADRARGRGGDGASGGSAAAAHRAAAAVEEGDGHAVLGAQARQAALRLRQLPVGGEIAAVLVRIRVADHHLLDLALHVAGCAAPGARPTAPSGWPAARRKSGMVSSSGTMGSVQRSTAAVSANSPPSFASR